MSKIQNGLQQGMGKIQSVQDASKVKKTINQLSSQKGKLLMELGSTIYLEYRKGNIQHEEISSRAEKLNELDVALHEQLVMLEELTKKPEEGITCECGTKLSESDQFCPNCGTKVVKPEDVVVEMKSCSTCNHEIAVDSNYCNICGAKA